MIKIRHTGIVTKNLKQSLDFWVTILGFKVKKKLNEKGELIDKIIGYKNVRVKTLKLVDSYGGLIEILFFFNSPKSKKISIKPYTNGYTHISLTVKNIQFIYTILKKKRIIFNSVPKESADGKVLMTYCKTPEGAFLELVQEL
jgi:catechol 2,3-dioxygenase-like lactoylglutathione lyase family enzyme